MLPSIKSLSYIKAWARNLSRDGYAIYLASRDPRVSWYAKVIAVAVAAYALSPIDLIPDFIPIMGYLDELIILPLGIWLVLSLIPKEIMVEYRAKADEAGSASPVEPEWPRSFCSGSPEH